MYYSLLSFKSLTTSFASISSIPFVIYRYIFLIGKNTIQVIKIENKQEIINKITVFENTEKCNK